jgi:exportin-1
VHGFVAGLFNVSMDLQTFKQHLRDFLISIKEFSPEDSAELFYEEQQVHANYSTLLLLATACTF